MKKLHAMYGKMIQSMWQNVQYQKLCNVDKMFYAKENVQKNNPNFKCLDFEIFLKSLIIQIFLSQQKDNLATIKHKHMLQPICCENSLCNPQLIAYINIIVQLRTWITHFLPTNESLVAHAQTRHSWVITKSVSWTLWRTFFSQLTGVMIPKCSNN